MPAKSKARAETPADLLAQLLAKTVANPTTGCMTIGTGPGRPTVWDPRKKRRVNAARFVLEETFGPIPDHLQACHKRECPARRCINPAHLYVGTPSQNMRDRYATGPNADGPENGRFTTIYSRVFTEDYTEMVEREKTMGAPIAAQVRIFVREGLRARRSVK